jgi:hypothetical protein
MIDVPSTMRVVLRAATEKIARGSGAVPPHVIHAH